MAAGVYWLRMPLPFALDHINLWLIEDSDGWTVVDCGIANETTRQLWQQIFAEGLQGKPVIRVLCTHMHPDHIGCADWLCQYWQAPLWMTGAEYLSARILSAGLPGTDATGAVAHYARHGMLPEHQEKIAARGGFYAKAVPSVPGTYFRLQHGDILFMGGYEWRVLCGFGHSPEHASLLCSALNIAITGDMLLPKISTNISVYPIEPDANPLKLFLDSLPAYHQLDPECLILPSHGQPFIGAGQRVHQLEQHHQQRLHDLLEFCHTASRTAVDVLPVLFRRELDLHQLTFALGEAIAHLNYLWHDGTLERHEQNGIYRFVAVPESRRGLRGARVNSQS